MTERFIEEKLKTPVGYECDVAVADGGPGGGSCRGEERGKDHPLLINIFVDM
ncbi:MAG: hypothetical protein LBR93_12000 [Treponema sp.]|jgi:hypothetical protein|nr:hypothetical protein [Treponema sp.]